MSANCCFSCSCPSKIFTIRWPCRDSSVTFVTSPIEVLDPRAVAPERLAHPADHESRPSGRRRKISSVSRGLILSITATSSTIASVSRITITTALEIASATCSVLYVSFEISAPEEPWSKKRVGRLEIVREQLVAQVADHRAADPREAVDREEVHHGAQREQHRDERRNLPGVPRGLARRARAARSPLSSRAEPRC